MRNNQEVSYKEIYFNQWEIKVETSLFILFIECQIQSIINIWMQPVGFSHIFPEIYTAVALT